MSRDQREVTRKLRILQHTEETGHVAKTCRYFGIGRSSFYRCRDACRKHDDAGLANRPPIPKWYANRTPIEIEEKILHLRSKYHSGPMLVPGTLPWHQDIRRNGLTDAQAQWRQPTAEPPSQCATESNLSPPP